GKARIRYVCIHGKVTNPIAIISGRREDKGASFISEEVLSYTEKAGWERSESRTGNGPTRSSGREKETHPTAPGHKQPTGGNQRDSVRKRLGRLLLRKYRSY